MANVAGERKKGRSRNAVENCGRCDNGRGIAAIFLMGGVFVAGVLMTAIIASKRKKEKTNYLDIREKKGILDSCKRATNRHEDDPGLLSILPLDVQASIEPIEQECRPGSSTNTDEKASLVLQEKELSEEFIQGLKKGEAPILESKIAKETDVFLPHLEAFPPCNASSLDGSSSPLLLQDDGCAGNRGGSGLDDCDGDSSLSLLLMQDDDGGGQTSNSDDYDMDHEKENSSVAFELENSAPGAITIPIVAEVISCGSYSYGPEGFSAGTSPISTWPQLSITGCSKQNSKTNRTPNGMSYDVGDDDDDQSKYVRFEQQQGSGIDGRKIFEEDMRYTQELAEEAGWSCEALGILQNVDTNLLILSVGAVLLFFILQLFIHANMS